MSQRSDSKLFRYVWIGFNWFLICAICSVVFGVVTTFVSIWRGESDLPSQVVSQKRTRDIEIPVRKVRTYDLPGGETYVNHKETPWGEVTFVTTQRSAEAPPRLLKIVVPPVQGGEPVVRFYVKEH